MGLVVRASTQGQASLSSKSATLHRNPPSSAHQRWIVITKEGNCYRQSWLSKDQLAGRRCMQSALMLQQSMKAFEAVSIVLLLLDSHAAVGWSYPHSIPWRPGYPSSFDLKWR